MSEHPERRMNRPACMLSGNFITSLILVSRPKCISASGYLRETKLQQPQAPVKRAYLLSIVVVGVLSAVHLFSAGAVIALPQLPSLGVEFVAELFLAVLAILLLTAWRSWRSVGFRELRSLKDLRFYWVPLFPVLPVVIATGGAVAQLPVSDIVFYFALACLVGFVEEVYFRGLMLRSLVSSGIWRAVVITSVLFGVAHLQNLVFGASLAATTLQVVYAAAMGFAFAAVALRTGVIWPLIVIHALIDFTGFVTLGQTVMTEVSPTDVAVLGAYSLLFVGYGVFVMRSVVRLQLQDGNGVARLRH